MQSSSSSLTESLLSPPYLPPPLPLASTALFAPRMFVARQGQKSPTALHDEGAADRDKDDGINYTTVDWREFMCNTWHLEPTLRSDPPPNPYVAKRFGGFKGTHTHTHTWRGG